MHSTEILGSLEYLDHRYHRLHRRLWTNSFPPAPLWRKIATYYKPLTGSACLTTVLSSAAVEAAPFGTARAAVRFAMTRVGRPAVPAITRMMGGGRLADGTALDGAAQAGMILTALRELGVVQFNAVKAGAAPRRLRCDCERDCCSGWRLNREWREAVAALAAEAERCLKTRHRDAMAVNALIAKIYGKTATLPQIAFTFDTDIEVIDKYHRALNRWLMGTAGKDPTEGLDRAAWRETDSLLRNCGIVGES